MKLFVKMSTLFLITMTFVACGDSNNSDTNNGDTNNNNMAAQMFDCDGETCDASTQYCLISAAGNSTATRECIALPTACTSCDCAQDDAPKQFPDSNNCSGLISCGSSNGKISVTCSIPPL